MSDEEVSQADQDEIRASFVETALDDLESRSEQFQVTIIPLGDSVGWRSEFHIVDGENQLFLAGASNKSVFASMSIAAARASVAFDALTEALKNSEEDSTTEEVDED